MRKRIIITAITVVTLLLTSGLPSSAASTQEQVDAVIARFGGVQTTPNTISWQNGTITLEIRTSGAPASTCSPGRYCAYQRAFFRGSVLSYSACPASYTDFSALLGSVGSVSNQRSTGTVRALANSSTVATLGPRQSSSQVRGITKITCS